MGDSYLPILLGLLLAGGLFHRRIAHSFGNWITAEKVVAKSARNRSCIASMRQGFALIGCSVVPGAAFITYLHNAGAELHLGFQCASAAGIAVMALGLIYGLIRIIGGAVMMEE